MFIIRCDVCSKEVPMEQPKFHPLVPDGWFSALGAAIQTAGGPVAPERAPHACSLECSALLLKRDDVPFVKQKVREPWQRTDYKPKGSANCKNCKRIGVGKTCMYHGVKQPGWPNVVARQ